MLARSNSPSYAKRPNMHRRENASKEEFNNYFREYRRLNADKIRKYARDHARKWRAENGTEGVRIYKKKYPDKIKAHQKVYRAVRSGKLKRSPCEICGAKAQGHHEDYSKPLEVKWLCTLHHAERHKELRLLITSAVPMSPNAL